MDIGRSTQYKYISDSIQRFLLPDKIFDSRSHYTFIGHGFMYGYFAILVLHHESILNPDIVKGSNQGILTNLLPVMIPGTRTYAWERVYADGKHPGGSAHAGR